MVFREPADVSESAGKHQLAEDGRPALAADDSDGDHSAESEENDNYQAVHPVAASGRQHAGPFKTEDKGAAIARAFVKVTHGRTTDTQAGAAILSGSKSVLKRQREEAADEAVEHKAKALRQEMRKRGHVQIPQLGTDPAHDAAEKVLLRTARKGVVRLFNAVSKAQKQVVEQQAVGRTKGQQLTKADFLAELRGASKVMGKRTKVMHDADASTALNAVPPQPTAASDMPAWGPLQDDDLTALTSGLKMKDWDKREEQPDVLAETLEDAMHTDSDGSM